MVFSSRIGKSLVLWVKAAPTISIWLMPSVRTPTRCNEARATEGVLAELSADLGVSLETGPYQHGFGGGGAELVGGVRAGFDVRVTAQGFGALPELGQQLAPDGFQAQLGIVQAFVLQA